MDFFSAWGFCFSRFGFPGLLLCIHRFRHCFFKCASWCWEPLGLCHGEIENHRPCSSIPTNDMPGAFVRVLLRKVTVYGSRYCGHLWPLS